MPAGILNSPLWQLVNLRHLQQMQKMMKMMKGGGSKKMMRQLEAMEVRVGFRGLRLVALS